MRKILGLLFALWASVALCATPLPAGKRQFLDKNGAPLANGKVYYYSPYTSALKNTYQDQGQTILNSNPIQLDSSGYGIIWGQGMYRELIKDQYGNTISDSITSSNDDAGAVIWGGHSTGAGNAQVVSAAGFSNSDGQIVIFIASYTNTAGLTLDVGSGPIVVKKDAYSGTLALTGSEVIAGGTYMVMYDQNLGIFHLMSNFDGGISAVNSTLSGIGTNASPLGIGTINHDTTLVNGGGLATGQLGVNTASVPLTAGAYKLYAEGVINSGCTISGTLFGLASVTSLGAGICRLNFSSALPATSYRIVATIIEATAGMVSDDFASHTLTTANVRTFNDAGTATDKGFHFQVWR
jgi:hypothetical protein